MARAAYVLHLSAEAKLVWVSFYNEWAKQQAQVEGDLAAAFSKLEAYAARFALLHHVVTHVHLDTADVRPVGPRSVEAGIALCQWFANEARRIYSTLTEDDEERNDRRLVEFIRARGGQITARALQKSNSRKYPSAETAEQALDTLVQAGLADWTERPTTAKGGRPTRSLILRPTQDTTDGTNDGEDEDGDDTPTDPPDTTPQPSTKPPFPRENEGCVGSVLCRTEEKDQLKPVVTAKGSDASSVVQDGVMSAKRNGSDQFKPYLLVRDTAGLAMVEMALGDAQQVGLDLETTGLNPRTERTRLLSLALSTIDGGTFSYLIDVFAVDPSPLWEALADKELVIHNGAFDLAFLSRMGFTPSGPVHDTMLMAQLLAAGTFDKCGLAPCCERWLNRPVDKTEQKSDWSGHLTEAQLEYAANDVEVLVPLLEVLTRETQEAKLAPVVSIEKRCLPALVWAGGKGVGFDCETWQRLASTAEAEANRLREELNRRAPSRPEAALFADPWHWDSPPQVKEVLAIVGCVVEKTDDDTLAGLSHPLAALLREYRGANKKVKTYGKDWLKHVTDDGRVYPGWRQIGAASGRMSCTDPNMQQVPRGEYRKCITAPAGRVLVKADYSQIELRIAAKVSGDAAMLEAYKTGEDLHTRTARSVLGIAEVTKQHRQLAKALNFGLLYGMGANGFRQYAKAQYGLDLSEDEAQRYRNAFFKSYPGLAVWHRRVGSSGKKALETRTLAGRRRSNVSSFTEKLNTPVQGTGADGLKLALALLWERREQVPGVFPVLIVHDEIVVEADAHQADAVADWLKTAMVEAMAPLVAPVPVEVEVKVARTWGGD